jgi:hypothetical protein
MTSATIKKTSAATLKASAEAFSLKPANLTVEGLTALSLDASAGLSRFALALFLAEQAGVKRADIMAATGLYKGRVSTLARAGEILSRCGKGAADVAREVTALTEKFNTKETGEKFGGMTGTKLVAAVVAADAAVKAEKKTRGAGKKVAAEKPEKRTPIKAVGAAHDALKAIESVPNTATARSLVESIVAQAFRVAVLAGLDPATVAADIMAAGEEVEAA